MIQNGNLVPILVGILALLAFGFFIVYNYQKEVIEKLRNSALIDDVLGLPNQLYFDQHLRRVMAWASQHKKTFSLLAVEIDRLDDYHLKREERARIIRSVLGKIQQHLLPEDFLAVWQLERFCFLVVLPENGAAAARGTAEQILTDVLSGCFHKKMPLITISIGVLGVDGENVPDPK